VRFLRSHHDVATVASTSASKITARFARRLQRPLSEYGHRFTTPACEPYGCEIAPTNEAAMKSKNKATAETNQPTTSESVALIHPGNWGWLG
jgi:hypothetical protein